MQLLLNELIVFSAAFLTDSLMSSQTLNNVSQISLILSKACAADCLRSKSASALQQDSRTRHKLCVKLLIMSVRIGS